MHSTVAKKIFLFISIFIIATLACDLTVTRAPSIEVPTAATTPIPVMETPREIPTQIPVTAISFAATAIPTAMPTSIPATSTSAPATNVPTVQPPSTAGTVTSYGALTLVVPFGVANGASGSQFPRVDGKDAPGWQKTPGHLQVMLGDYYILQGKSQQPQIYVYPAQAYAEMVPSAFESIRRLDNILYSPGGPSLGADQLPTIPFFNAQQVFTSNAQVISFKNGSGVRFLTEYAQYPASANNQDLFYNFQGVTRDGAYYIVAVFPVTVPVLAETSDAGAPLPSGGVPYPYMANPKADMKVYYASVIDVLNATPPEMFTPTLNQLDEMIQSMQITP